MAGAKRKVGERELEIWRMYAAQRQAEGEESLWQIAKELAQDCDKKTVYSYLNPDARERHNASARRSIERVKERKRKRNEQSKKYRQAHLDEERAYDLAYSHFRRKPEEKLSECFGDNETLTLEQLSERVSEVSDGKLHGEFTKNWLQRYMERERGPPYLEENPEGVYRLRHET